jgi:hypothetical protein
MTPAISAIQARPKAIDMLRKRGRQLDHQKKMARIDQECAVVLEALQKMGAARTSEISQVVGLDQSCVLRRLHQLGNVVERDAITGKWGLVNRWPHAALNRSVMP